MSDFEFFFVLINIAVSVHVLSTSSTFFCVVLRAEYIRLPPFVSVWMGPKFNEFIYNNNFVFASTGFDTKFAAFVAAR